MGCRINRRRILQAAAGPPFVSALLPRSTVSAAALPRSRIRPGDPGWPLEADWTQLGRDVGGNIIKVQSPLAACVGQTGEHCARLFGELKNPYFLGDEPGLTQTSGWVGAWTSRPSAYAVAVLKTADVVAAINFARARNLRLVVRGGGIAISANRTRLTRSSSGRAT